MTKTVLLLATLAILSACTTIENHYAITGDSNRFDCPSTAAPIKTIDTGLSASASQSGNAGAETSK